MLNRHSSYSSQAIQLFEPEPEALYSIEAVAHLAHVPRRTILVYYKHGLIAPASDPDRLGYRFSGEAIRKLRSIESLRTVCGNDFAGIRIILDLMNELERLRNALE